MPELSEHQCYVLIRRLLTYPCHEIRVHSAACMVIQEMEAAGMALDIEFVMAVVKADDTRALAHVQEKLG